MIMLCWVLNIFKKIYFIPPYDLLFNAFALGKVKVVEAVLAENDPVAFAGGRDRHGHPEEVPSETGRGLRHLEPLSREPFAQRPKPGPWPRSIRGNPAEGDY